MKRRIFLAMWLLLPALSLHAQDHSYFRYHNVGRIDYVTGRSVANIHGHLDFEDTINIKRAVIEVMGTGGTERYEVSYANGLLVRRVEDAPERAAWDFAYDGAGRLKSYGIGWTYKYPGANVRELYYGGTLWKRETALEDEGHKTVLVEERRNSGGDVLSPAGRIDYFYEAGRLATYEQTDYFKARTVISRIDFTYEGGLPVRIVDGYGADDIRYITTIAYDGENRIQEISRECVYRPEDSTVEKFGGYDEHGNWHWSELYRGGTLAKRLLRTIEYLQ